MQVSEYRLYDAMNEPEIATYVCNSSITEPSVFAQKAHLRKVYKYFVLDQGLPF